MRLKDIKGSKNFRDETWIPESAKEYLYEMIRMKDRIGEGVTEVPVITQRPPNSYESVLTNPNNSSGFSPEEWEMRKQGLSYKEIMFKRLLDRYKNWELPSGGAIVDFPKRAK